MVTVVPTKTAKARDRTSVTLRDAREGYKTLAAVAYCAVAEVLALVLMSSSNNSSLATTALAIVLAAHGRVMASFLVHECAHSSIFVEPRANARLGKVCLWLSGCPYADYDRVRDMHLKHHADRTDTVEFDYRAFIKRLPGPLIHLILLGEWCFVPVVETLMHLRTAWAPLVYPAMGRSRRQSALVGTLVMTALYGWLWSVGGLGPHLLAGALTLQIIQIHDCFAHTYEAHFQDEAYVPGPGTRTRAYEEANTYSPVLTLALPALNGWVALNFGYHNAHHVKPMVPWYKLPAVHAQLYAATHPKGDSSQVLTLGDLWGPWVAHRLRRVLEEDYGVVHAPDQPGGRVADYVGTLGVSFLTV
jgi:fatty acid desaturase